MARELGGSQISALLESVPGIVNVLRNPVADAMMGMIRTAAGLEEFNHDYANELVQYATRRGLIQSTEGEEVLAEVRSAVPKRRRAKGKKVGTAARKAPAKKPTGRVAKNVVRKPAKKPTAKPARKSTGRPVKKAAKVGRR
jgi:hypothetical protein